MKSFTEDPFNLPAPSVARVSAATILTSSIRNISNSAADGLRSLTYWWILLWDRLTWPTALDSLPSKHNIDVIMGTVASQITNLTIVYSTVYSGADQRKHQSSALLAFVHWGLVTHICASKLYIISPHSGFFPGRRQTIIWTNVGILLIGPLGKTSVIS